MHECCDGITKHDSKKNLHSWIGGRCKEYYQIKSESLSMIKYVSWK